MGLGDILVLQYYHDKYIHDNITKSILAYHDNCANNNTATTVDTHVENLCLLCNEVYAI